MNRVSSFTKPLPGTFETRRAVQLVVLIFLELVGLIIIVVVLLVAVVVLAPVLP